MATQTDYYVLLGVSRSATDEQIRSAYRKLARQFHPDVNSASDASDRFKAITEAYEVLTAISSRRSSEETCGAARPAARCGAPTCGWRSRSTSSTLSRGASG
jgi:DnaJ-class molecular chaperone